jgi:hypothetical protein
MMIGKTLMIQHKLAEVAIATLCHMASVSDAFTPNGHTRVQVIWTLSAKRIDEHTCEYTKSVVVHPTAEFMEFIAAHNISFEDAAAARQHDGGDPNRRETPLFAGSIERQALGRAQGLQVCLGVRADAESGTALRECAAENRTGDADHSLPLSRAELRPPRVRHG